MAVLLRFAVLSFLLLGTHSARAQEEERYLLKDYGRDCARELGVEVPRFSCQDPNSFEVPVTSNGRTFSQKDGRPKDGCETPAHGSNGCTPGTRLLKYVDYVRRPGTQRDEKVTTSILCRRMPGDAGTSRFWEVLVIQHNETRNLSCFFGAVGGRDGAAVPPPVDSRPGAAPLAKAEAFWGKTPNFAFCLTCHESQPYIRTPFIKLADDAKGGYVRKAGQAAYQVGKEGNGIPDIAKRGPACPVGSERMPARFKTDRPNLIKINLSAYEKLRFPKGAPGGVASLDTCTRCHYLGRSFGCGLVNDASGHGEGNRARSLSTTGARFPDRFWMPPQDRWPKSLRDGISVSESFARSAPALSLASPPLGIAVAGAADRGMQEALAKGYDRYYGPALEAIRFCCANPDAVVASNGKDVPVCRGTFRESPDALAPCAPFREPPRAPDNGTH